MRFEKFHPEDFQEINWKAWASTRFKAWIEHTDNKIFRHHYENGCSPGERDALYGTMMEPFEIFDSINDWDIPDGEVSCYTYVSILGQGVMIPFFTLLIQFVVPFLLVTNQFGDYHDFLECEGVFGGGFLNTEEFAPGACVKNTNNLVLGHNGICPQRGDPANKIMIFLMLLIYITKVVPDCLKSLISKVGDGSSDVSRLYSLRRLVWDADEDTLVHKIGYRIDALMGGAFPCILYGINVYMIYTTNDILDILLNALAIEFIHQLDEMYVSSSWWDQDYRYLKAGAIEMAMRRYLGLQKLTDLGLNDIAASRKEELNALGNDVVVNAKARSMRKRALKSGSVLPVGEQKDSALLVADGPVTDGTMKASRVTLPPLSRGPSTKEMELFGKAESAILEHISSDLDEQEQMSRAWSYIRKRKKGFLDAEIFGMPLPKIFDRYERFRCWKRFTDTVPDPACESALETLDEDPVLAKGLIYTCGTRMKAILARKQRLLDFEVKLIKGYNEDHAMGHILTDYLEMSLGSLSDHDRSFILAYKTKASAALQEFSNALTFAKSGYFLKRTLFGHRTFESHRIGARREIRLIFFFLDAIVTWLSTVIQIIFPFIMVAAVVVLPICY